MGTFALTVKDRHLLLQRIQGNRANPATCGPRGPSQHLSRLTDCPDDQVVRKKKKFLKAQNAGNITKDCV